MANIDLDKLATSLEYNNSLYELKMYINLYDALEELKKGHLSLVYESEIGEHLLVELDISESIKISSIEKVTPIEQHDSSEKADKLTNTNTDLDGDTQEKMIKINPAKILNPLTSIGFPSLNGMVLIGKVDTGADTSSLHVDEWKADEVQKTVKFRIGESNWFTMHVNNFQAIKTVNQETVYRPTVNLSVIIADNVYENILFNLNNREGMDEPVLIGNNLLKHGKFIVKPN